ncbi:type II toxin-antitoxin system VapC family toxin [Spirosoma areae]
MNLLLDTNIVMAILKSRNAIKMLSYINPHKTLMYISVVVEAEIKTLAIRNRWSENRLAQLDSFLEQIRILEINQTLVATYVEIDTYSQRQNPNFTKYSFNTPRNMGKNDLWIAATAALLGLTLVTTDRDFDHLNTVFLEVRSIRHEELKPFLS